MGSIVGCVVTEGHALPYIYILVLSIDLKKKTN